jgi:hypothetical protein
MNHVYNNRRTFYTLPIIAIRWSGNTAYENQILKELLEAEFPENASTTEKRFSGFPGFALKYSILIEAIENGDLVHEPFNPCLDRNKYEHISLITVNRSELVKWMKSTYPNEKPSFLFGKTDSLRCNDTDIDERSHATYLNIIGALLAFIEGGYNLAKHQNFKSKGILEDALSGKFDVYGLSKANLQKKFSQARKTLKIAIEEKKDHV